MQGPQLVTVIESEHGEFTDTYDIHVAGDDLVFGRHTSVQKRDGRYMGEPRTTDSDASIFKRVR